MPHAAVVHQVLGERDLRGTALGKHLNSSDTAVNAVSNVLQPALRGVSWMHYNLRQQIPSQDFRQRPCCDCNLETLDSC